MTLVVTYAPHDHESAMGYYRRLAADNLVSWRELAGLADLPRNRNALLTQPEAVATALGLELEWAEFACRQDEMAPTAKGLRRSLADAVCPDCLLEAVYIRDYWEHAYVTACPHHHTKLVDHCNECGAALSPHRFHIDSCDCGHPLSMLPRDAANPSQLWLSTLIASGGAHSGGIEPAMNGIDVGVLAQVIRTLCSYADPENSAPRRGSLKPRYVHSAIDFLAPLEALLAAWPDGFQSHVKMRIAAGRPKARTLNSLLGPWYVTLRKLCQGTVLEPFLTAIIEVAAERFDGVLGMDSTKSIVEGVTAYIRRPDAAKSIGISDSRLHKAIQNGECAYRTRRVGTRGELYEIPLEEVERIKKSRDGWISEKEAGELMGVPASVVQNMMLAGVIRSDVNWRHDILKGGLIERNSIQTLAQRVRDMAVPRAGGVREKITWAGLTTRRMGDKQAIQETMRAVVDGTITAAEIGSRLGEMEFLRSDIVPYFGTPLLESGFSVQQLSKITGWKWESISHWIETGLLESESIVLRGQRCRVVLPHQLLTFRQKFVPIAELARALETKSSALSKLLVGIEFVGAQQLPNGAMRGVLVRTADLCKLAVLGAKAGKDMFVPIPNIDG